MTQSLEFEVQKRIFSLRLIAFVLAAIAIIYLYLNYKREIVNLRKFSSSIENELKQRDQPVENVSGAEEMNLAEKLSREVRVLCWIMTTPANHINKAIHVRRTWGKRCNRLVFVTTEKDIDLGETFVIHNFTDSYQRLWTKTRRAFEHVYRRYGNEMDWFMKADDDTFVFVENLRYLLYSYSPDMPIYFGHNFKLNGNLKSPYMSGGAGYVLSRESLRRFVEIAMNNSDLCQSENAEIAEDLAMGMCLHAMDVIAGDSRDAHNELRFVPYEPFPVLIANYFTTDLWFHTFTLYHHRACQNCLSKHAIAFHYMAVEDMYLCEFFLYQFQILGLPEDVEALPKKLSIDQVNIPFPFNVWNITEK